MNEVIRVSCPNEECPAFGKVWVYDEGYRGHSITLCGSCEGELSELMEDEEKVKEFRRVKLHNPRLSEKDPQVKGMTRREQRARAERAVE